MNREVWQATVHGVAKSQTQLKRLSVQLSRMISKKIGHMKKHKN